MLGGGWSWLTCVAAIGCSLVGGVFFAFSSFVMTALSRLPASQGIAAMQSINVVVINVSFMTLLFGTAAACMSAAGMALLDWQRPGAGWALAGSLIYLVGTIGVTILFNVPRNDALAAVSADGAEGAAIWASYLTQWTAYNHVRTIAAILAAALLVVSLRAPSMPKEIVASTINAAAK